MNLFELAPADDELDENDFQGFFQKIQQKIMSFPAIVILKIYMRYFGINSMKFTKKSILIKMAKFLLMNLLIT